MSKYEIDSYLTFLKDLGSKIESLGYSKEDVRYAFYGTIRSALNSFYVGLIIHKVAEEIDNENILFKPEIINLKPHISMLRELHSIDLKQHSHFASINRNLLLDAWTCFETSLTVIFDHVATEKEKEGIAESMNSSILKLIEQLKGLLSNEDDEDISESLRQEILKKSFLPLLRRFRFIAKRIPDCYGGKYKEDSQFLQFYSKFRNCLIHSNGIYYGNYCEYEYYGHKFIFKNSETFIQQGEDFNICWHLANRLLEIFDSVSECIKDEEFIEQPSETL